MRAPPSLPEVASFLSLLSLTFQAQFLHRHKTTCSGLYSKTDDRLGGAAPSSRALPSGRVSGEARAAVAAVCPPLGGHSRAWGLLSEEVGKARGRAPGPRDHGVLTTARPPGRCPRAAGRGAGRTALWGRNTAGVPAPQVFGEKPGGAGRAGAAPRRQRAECLRAHTRAFLCVSAHSHVCSCVRTFVGVVRAHVRVRRGGACAVAGLDEMTLLLRGERTLRGRRARLRPWGSGRAGVGGRRRTDGRLGVRVRRADGGRASLLSGKPAPRSPSCSSLCGPALGFPAEARPQVCLHDFDSESVGRVRINARRWDALWSWCRGRRVPAQRAGLLHRDSGWTPALRRVPSSEAAGLPFQGRRHIRSFS